MAPAAASGPCRGRPRHRRLLGPERPGHRTTHDGPRPRSGAGKEHAVLAYLITEPELAMDGPLDATLGLAPDDAALLAALAYEAALECTNRCWIPARRRPSAVLAVPVA